LRNDGSTNSLKCDFGDEALTGLAEILDHGYFYSPSPENSLKIDEEYVAINVTDDQLAMKGVLAGEDEWYYQELEGVVKYFHEKGLKIVLVPHVHQDVEAIGKVLGRIDTQLVRTAVIVAPCLQDDVGADIIFNIYKNAKLVVASRYHANVCSIKFGVPLIGLSPLPRIRYTHEQFLTSKSGVYVEKGFSKKIVEILEGDENLVVSREKLNLAKEATLRFYRDYFRCEDDEF